jgi:cytochrome c556
MMVDDAMESSKTMANGSVATGGAMSDDDTMMAGLGLDATEVISARRSIMRSVGAHTGLLSTVA